LEAESRWVVTGTPIQNRISELASLFRFLRLDPYCNKKVFDDHITRPWKSGSEQLAVKRLKKLLQFTMLRRPGTILNLPDRHDFREMLQFSAVEQRAYDVAKQVAIQSLDAALMAERKQYAFINALQKINALRIFCNHGKATMPASPGENAQDSGDDPGEWNAKRAEQALRELSAAVLDVSCSSCQASYSDETAQGVRRLVYVTQCLGLYCHMCYSEELLNGAASFCDCAVSCPVACVSMDSSLDALAAAEPERVDYRDGHESTKVRALVRDLNVWAPKAKW
jgi:SWI/SNF-related matrix-associated actin-dependent regulator of chromatin subfamily A3